MLRGRSKRQRSWTGAGLDQELEARRSRTHVVEFFFMITTSTLNPKLVHVVTCTCKIVWSVEYCTVFPPFLKRHHTCLVKSDKSFFVCNLSDLAFRSPYAPRLRGTLRGFRSIRQAPFSPRRQSNLSEAYSPPEVNITSSKILYEERCTVSPCSADACCVLGRRFFV